MDPARRPGSFFGSHMTDGSDKVWNESSQQQFERALSREPLRGLKAILDSLAGDREAVWEAVRASHSYDEFLGRLGYRITLTKQIHVQDCYSRVGVAGGIKTVLPYYDIPTQSSLPTLINFDGTVTTTPKAATFFNKLLSEFKTQLADQTPSS
jgi:hypothetical protein